VETEISGSMAQLGREKHQILPLFYDPQMPYHALTHQEIMHEVTDFYKDLLSEPKVDCTSAIEQVTQNIPTIIT
jgi:hypothetical protein